MAKQLELDMKTITEEGPLGPMYDPPHPGEIIKELLLPELRLSEEQAADLAMIPRATFSAMTAGTQRITAELADALSTWLGTGTELWLALQEQYDAWQEKQALTKKTR